MGYSNESNGSSKQLQTIENLKQNAKTSEAQEVLTRTQNRLAEIQEYVAAETKDDATSTIKWNLDKIRSEAGSATAKKYVDQLTADNLVKLAEAEAAGALLKNELTRAQTELTKAQIQEISAKMQNRSCKNIRRRHRENKGRHSCRDTNNRKPEAKRINKRSTRSINKDTKSTG